MLAGSIRKPAKLLQRSFSQLATSKRGQFPEGFVLLSAFFDPREQHILLTTALNQLDLRESKRIRKLQKEYRTNNPVSHNAPLESIFLPERYYSFEGGHYDNVIRDYREIHLTSWPETEVPGLTGILNRLRACYPSQHTQTHLLHLSSTGEILPHVDNISASGVWIVGVSLGATRMLRMEATNVFAPQSFSILLPSGSVYLQRDDVRYNWKHSIVYPRGPGDIKRGQRLSIMIRDRKEEGCSVSVRDS